MPLSDDILARLRCPVTGSALTRADVELVARANARIAASGLLTRISDPVAEPLEGALVNADRSLLYRIEEGVVELLSSDAIEIWEL